MYFPKMDGMLPQMFSKRASLIKFMVQLMEVLIGFEELDRVKLVIIKKDKQ